MEGWYRRAAIEPNVVDEGEEAEDFVIRRRTEPIVQIRRGGGPFAANGPALNHNIGEGEGLSWEHYGYVDEGEDSDESAPELE